MSMQTTINHAPAPAASADVRARRLLQIIGFTLLGLGLAILVAQGYTQKALFAGVLAMTLAGYFAWQKKVSVAATVFLWTLMVMLSALAWHSAGVRDLAVLGYPVLLVFAAILGSPLLFFSLLSAIVAYCSLLAVLTINGHFIMVIPPLSWAHLIFTNVILILTGFSVYLLLMDMRRLMGSLREENQRVTEREQMIARLANKDQLTGLTNRRYAEQQFDLLLEQSRQQHRSLLLLFLDLDNFKPVNDSLGHAAGDLLLQELSARLQELQQPGEVLCRFGGDEFLWLVLADRKQPVTQQAQQRAQQLLEAATRPFFIMQTHIDISGSVGIALAPEHGESFAELCRSADLAMYDAKEKGRNTFSYFHDDLNRISVDKFYLLKLMRDALKEEQFHLYYQPQYDLSDGRIHSCEALLRWPQKGGQFINPDQFIPLAESSGIIHEIGRWVLERACTDCMNWRTQGFGNVGVAVNISMVQFRGGNLPELVETILRRTGLPAHLLELELTESLLISDDNSIQQQLDRLHAMGVTLAIDDFGTGYSNLGYLRRFNASRLKIDKSFVSALGVSDRDKPLVRAMIQMAHSLDLKVVAEGVEDEDTLQQLRLLGCDDGQGWLWSKALPMPEWLDYLQQNTNNRQPACSRPPLLQ
ncbi:putative bifunctional diguanylate cyclase/phosphodiesterase [Venatoribacter cucullus]|uniref:putative bifunctional diguanylate cyclase/phosphodiesterase n=1 Tax=Venatoribacter cucullus TaxID=2661630 RepID=UPI0022406B5B|nr:EAL domain-containing protein [Venatoribacter cucullus]